MPAFSHLVIVIWAISSFLHWQSLWFVSELAHSHRGTWSYWLQLYAVLSPSGLWSLPPEVCCRVMRPVGTLEAQKGRCCYGLSQGGLPGGGRIWAGPWAPWKNLNRWLREQRPFQARGAVWINWWNKGVMLDLCRGLAFLLLVAQWGREGGRGRPLRVMQRGWNWGKWQQSGKHWILPWWHFYKGHWLIRPWQRLKDTHWFPHCLLGKIQT